MSKSYDDYAKKRRDAIIQESDMVNHPTHYTSHPSGIEVIQITEHMNFCLGNAIKYILRSGHKGKQIEDLKKAIWYINREIDRIQSLTDIPSYDRIKVQTIRSGDSNGPSS